MVVNHHRLGHAVRLSRPHSLVAKGRPIVLFRSPWSKTFAKEHNSSHDLLEMG